MALENHLYYINENKVLRCVPMQYKFDEASQNETWTAVVPERYLITGMYLNGRLIDSLQGIFLLELGLKPIELFLFRCSNFQFKIAPEEYRVENEKVIFTRNKAKLAEEQIRIPLP